MSLDTYANLKTSITAWVHRADLADHLDTFIDMAEAVMNRKLRVSDMETRATITTADEYTALPTGFLEMVNIQINDTYSYPLEYRTPHQMDVLETGESGRPSYYTIVGNEIQLYPATAGYTLEIDYYKSVTPLSDTEESNFVLASHPDVYLNGCLRFAYMWARNGESAAMHGAEFERLLEEMNQNSNRKKFSGAPLRVISG